MGLVAQNIVKVVDKEKMLVAQQIVKVVDKKMVVAVKVRYKKMMVVAEMLVA